MSFNHIYIHLIYILFFIARFVKNLALTKSTGLVKNLGQAGEAILGNTFGSKVRRVWRERATENTRRQMGNLSPHLQYTVYGI